MRRRSAAARDLGGRCLARQPHKHPVTDPAAETEEGGPLEAFEGHHDAGTDGEDDLQAVGLRCDGAADSEGGRAHAQVAADCETQTDQQLGPDQHLFGTEKLR